MSVSKCHFFCLREQKKKEKAEKMGRPPPPPPPAPAALRVTAVCPTDLYKKRICRPGWHRNCVRIKSSQVGDHFTCIFKKVNISLGPEVSWCDYPLAQTRKELFSEVRIHAGTVLRRWISKLTTSHLQILRQKIFCRFYSKFSKSFDHHGKMKEEMLKNSFEK